MASWLSELFTAEGYRGFSLSNHQIMLQDRTRVRTFARALRAAIAPGATVVDAGCGTGILSFLAAQAGAGRVVGVDSSPLIEKVRTAAAALESPCAFEFLREDLVYGEFPEIRADVAVCELLGAFGIDEGIVAVSRRLRQDLLRPGGTLIPSRLEVWLSPVCSKGVHRELTFWSRPQFGFDLSPLQPLAYDHVYTFTDTPARDLGAPQKLYDIELGLDDLAKETTVSFGIERAGVLHGFRGWFWADLGRGIRITNDPRKPTNHWQTIFLPIGAPIDVRPGGTAKLIFRFNGEAHRGAWNWSGEVRPGPKARPIEFRHGVG